jgi:membrane-bound acyltransferase YfiQ involved in biofilm formation
MFFLCLAIMERVNYEAILECLSEFFVKTHICMSTIQTIHFLAQLSDFNEPGA